MVDALILYIPIQAPLANARQAVVIFISIYTVFFGIIFWLINKRFGWFYEKIELDKKTIEGISKEVLNLNHEMEDIVAERTMGMIGLRVADRIRNPVTVIGGLCKQLSKKKWKEFLKINLKISCLSAKKWKRLLPILMNW